MKKLSKLKTPVPYLHNLLGQSPGGTLNNTGANAVTKPSVTRGPQASKVFLLSPFVSWNEQFPFGRWNHHPVLSLSDTVCWALQEYHSSHFKISPSPSFYQEAIYTENNTPPSYCHTIQKMQKIRRGKKSPWARGSMFPIKACCYLSHEVSEGSTVPAPRDPKQCTHTV